MIDQGTYPQLRPSRIGAGASPGVQLAPLPRSRVFQWIENVTVNTRRTLSTPRLQGPVIIKSFSFYVATHSAAVTAEIGYASVSITEAGVALTTPRPYTLLTEKIDPFGVLADISGRGLLDGTIPNTNVRYSEPLDLIIDQADVFVCLATWNNSALAQVWTGTLRVVENVLRSGLEQYY